MKTAQSSLYIIRKKPLCDSYLPKFMLRNFKDEILRRFTPQNDAVCHSEESEKSNLMLGFQTPPIIPTSTGERGKNP